ncbi:MAG: hypothetical protein WCT77_01930 [Bacteroidota bacterium]
MKFKENEIQTLETFGFDILNPVKAQFDEVSVLKIEVEKVGTNCVNFFVDVCSDDDLERANGGRTELDLSWEEVISVIEEYL